MNRQLQEHIDFHKSQLPCLNVEGWEWNEMPNFLDLMCWKYLAASVKDDALRIQSRICIRCTGTRYIFSMELSSDYGEYPRFSEARQLSVKENASYDELRDEYTRTKVQIVKENLGKWLQAKKDWEAEFLGET